MDNKIEDKTGVKTKDGEDNIPNHQAKNKIYILVGIPCSGKSFYAQKLMLKYPNIKHVSSDEIRKELTGTYRFSSEVNDLVFNIAHARIFKALSYKFDVIFDATNVNKKYRSHIIQTAKENNAETVAIVLNTPLWICLQRNTKRDSERRVPQEIIKKMSKGDLEISKLEGFDEVRYIK